MDATAHPRSKALETPTPNRIAHFINGARVDAADGPTSPVYNPATGAQTGILPLADRAQGPLTLTTGNVITSGPGITNTIAFTIATSTLISEGKLQLDGDDMRVLYRDVLGWHLLPTQISSIVSPTAVITFPLAGELPDSEGTYWLYYGNAVAGPGPELEAPDVTAGQVITSITGTGTVTPTVTFFADPRLAWVGQSISFTNYVTPVAAIETFTWNFGDGITSTISNTNHAYYFLSKPFNLGELRQKLSSLGCPAEHRHAQRIAQDPGQPPEVLGANQRDP